jgi:hypothetical protein
MEQAPHHERIWRGKSVRQTRGTRRTLDRGVSVQPLPTPDHHAEKIPSLAGLSPWVLMDFHSPRRLLPGTQDYYNRKGLVSNLGQHKQAFYVLQKYYRELDSTK